MASVEKKQSKGLVLILTKGKINDLIELEQGLSIKTILEAAVPVCMQLKEHGRAAIAIALDIQLMRLAEAMNVKHNLKSGAITTIAYDLIEKYPNETLEDFILVFKRMRQGYYGEAYHLLNQASIFNCVQLHLEEKWEEHERQLREQKALLAKEESLALSDQAIKDAYGIVRNEKGELVYTGEAVGPHPTKREQTKDEAYQEFKQQRIRKKAAHQKTVEGQKELLNQYYGDQTESRPEGIERGPADEAGTSE